MPIIRNAHLASDSFLLSAESGLGLLTYSTCFPVQIDSIHLLKTCNRHALHSSSVPLLIPCLDIGLLRMFVIFQMESNKVLYLLP